MYTHLLEPQVISTEGYSERMKGVSKGKGLQPQ